MLNNYIKEAISLNKIDLGNINGVKLYYSKTKCLISSLVCLLLMIGCFSQIIANIKDNPTVMIFIALLLFFTYELQETFSKVLYKNPVLILSNDKLYYIKTQKWYDLVDYKFEDKYRGRLNFQLTYYMEDKNENNIFQINNWNLDNYEEFKLKLRYNKKKALKMNA
jgi:hypothetical protein